MVNPVTAFANIKQDATEGATGVSARATQALAEAGADNACHMTSLRTAQAIAALGKTAAPNVIIEDQKAAGTHGGTFTSGARRTRELNTFVRNVASLASLSSNQFTLPAGTYYLRWSAPAYKGDAHKSILRNITDSVDVKAGTSEHSSASSSDFVTSHSFGSAVFTIAASKAFEIQHQITTTRNTDGFGWASFITTEVYTRVEIWKVS